MTTATYTCTVFKANQPKVVYKGDQSVSGMITWGAANNASDVCFLAKVPHGATIVDFYEYHSANASAMAISFGLSKGVAAGGGGGASVFISGGAQATMNRFSIANWKGSSVTPGNVFPPVVSLSDLDPIRYATLTGTIAAGVTSTTSIKVWFTLIYRMDGPQQIPPGAQADVP